MLITEQEIRGFEKRFRTTFINSLGGFKSLALIGTIDKKEKTNLAVFNSLFHVGADPALIGFVVRPDSVERHTLSNIRENKCFTINHVLESFFTNAHQTSARYSSEVSEFSEAGLTEFFLDGHPAPFVKESVIRIGAEIQEILDLKVNGTSIVIGRIVNVSLPDNVLGADGFVDLGKAGTITCSGLDAYYNVTPLGRLTYAKPDSWPQKMDRHA